MKTLLINIVVSDEDLSLIKKKADSVKEPIDMVIGPFVKGVNRVIVSPAFYLLLLRDYSYCFGETVNFEVINRAEP